MMLFCHWPQPELRGEEVAEVWKEQLVAFSDVKADAVGREWFYDCDKARKALRTKLLKQRVRNYCAGYEAFQLEERDKRWDELVHYAATCNFRLGDSRAEQRFRKLMSALISLEEGKPEWGLRIRVVGGGCSGMSYELGWDDAAGDDDNITEVHGVKVFVDSKSAPYLQGSEIDYVDNNMLGAGFAINNPNVKSSCGCGSSHQF